MAILATRPVVRYPYPCLCTCTCTSAYGYRYRYGVPYEYTLRYSIVGGGTLHFLPFFPSLILPPLRSRPLKSSYRVWGSAIRCPSGVWGGAPAEIEFGAFKPKNLTPGCNNCKDFPENQLETWTNCNLSHMTNTLLWWQNGIARWWSDNFRWWNGNFRWLRNGVPAFSAWI